ncbi:MAG: DUF2306 domain-containing protein [Gemmatimonadetes bacterium]|nr:DUF2306 domain-containing protein [Gemmatimonadota bacterium]
MPPATAHPRAAHWTTSTVVLWSIMMLMATAIAGYGLALFARPDLRPQFMRESPVPIAVLAHFGGGGLALLLGPWQFMTGRLRKRSTMHVRTGRLYVIGVLVGASAGLVLAPFAQTGLTARLGFGCLALLTLGTTGRAFQLVRRGRIMEHRRWMIRSFALILAGVSLRIQIPVALIAGLAFESAYPVIAWSCWVPNLLIAEWFLARNPVGDSPT